MAREDYSANVTVANEYTLYGTGTLFARVTVGTSAVEAKVGASKLTGRKTVGLKAHPDNTGYVYVGFTNLVSSTNYGWVLAGGDAIEFTLDSADGLEVWLIGSAAGQYVGLIEGID